MIPRRTLGSVLLLPAILAGCQQPVPSVPAPSDAEIGQIHAVVAACDTAWRGGDAAGVRATLLATTSVRREYADAKAQQAATNFKIRSTASSPQLKKAILSSAVINAAMSSATNSTSMDVLFAPDHFPLDPATAVVREVNGKLAVTPANEQNAATYTVARDETGQWKIDPWTGPDDGAEIARAARAIRSQNRLSLQLMAITTQPATNPAKDMNDAITRELINRTVEEFPSHPSRAGQVH